MTKKLEDMTVEELVAENDAKASLLKKVNAESDDRRRKLEALEQEKEAVKNAALSDSEKLQAKVTAIEADHKALQDELHEARIHTAILEEAAKLGFANPEDVFGSFIDLSEVDTTDGKVTGFEKSLKVLAESGRLTMKTEDQRRYDGLGTPPGRSKPTKSGGTDKDLPPIKVRL